MLLISRDWRWEFSFEPLQWLVGFNIHDECWNIFFLCFRIGHNSESFTSKMRGTPFIRR